ncbi:MAG: hypothetical protein RR382_13000 [Tannerellaceae bacterium]
MRQIFDEIFGVKCLQSGKLMSIHENYLTHDCSTLGRNSGSRIIDISTGEAVDLHFRDLYKQENSAVSAAVVKKLIDSI